MSGIIARIRTRHQGISRVRVFLYGIVWLVRKMSFGLIRIEWRIIQAQPVVSPKLKKRPSKYQMKVLMGESLIEADRLDEGGAFSREPRDAKRFLRRVKRGDICVAAFDGQRSLGVLWLSTSDFDESDFKTVFSVRSSKKLAWDSNLYIVDDARGGFLFLQLWDRANEYLRQQGFEWVASQASAFNGPSLAAHKRMNSRRLGWLVVFLVGRRQINISSLAPRLVFVGLADSNPIYSLAEPEG